VLLCLNRCRQNRILSHDDFSNGLIILVPGTPLRVESFWSLASEGFALVGDCHMVVIMLWASVKAAGWAERKIFRILQPGISLQHKNLKRYFHTYANGLQTPF
jgi:hypothetical protein